MAEILDKLGATAKKLREDGAAFNKTATELRLESERLYQDYSNKKRESEDNARAAQACLSAADMIEGKKKT